MAEILDGGGDAFARLCGEDVGSGNSRDLARWGASPSLLAEAIGDTDTRNDYEERRRRSRRRSPAGPGSRLGGSSAPTATTAAAALAHRVSSSPWSDVVVDSFEI